MLFRTYRIVPVFEFRHFVFRNKETWEKGDITNPFVLINNTESKLKSLQEERLWVANDPMKSNMLALTTFIRNLTNQLYSKVTTKQFNKSVVNSNSSTVASGKNEKYDAPKPGERFTKMFRKQLKTYCGKCNKGKGFWGWHEEKNHDGNYVPKQQDNARKHENRETPQLQLEDDMKKALITLTRGMGDETNASETDFQRAERRDLNIIGTLGNSYSL